MKILVLYLFIGIILWLFTLSIEEKEPIFIKVRGFLILFYSGPYRAYYCLLWLMKQENGNEKQKEVYIL